ncbi:MAG: hypothetical protein U1E51_02000 [Candidatus Binatia bacterium]|nr:hypothetical protein [Candidatus Binatia bacterium]
MYLIEFERVTTTDTSHAQGRELRDALAVRLLDLADTYAGPQVIAEAIFTGDPGVALTGDQDIAVLKLPLTHPKGA